MKRLRTLDRSTPLILALGLQRQADLCEFKASLIYKVSFRTTRAIKQRNPVLKQQNKTKQNQTKRKIVAMTTFLMFCLALFEFKV